MPPSKPALIELLARVHISLADIAGRDPFPEATDLVSVGEDCSGRRARLAADAAPAWQQMRDAAAAAGIELLLVSAYRSYDYQVRLWEKKLAAGATPAEIRRVLAVPGFSQHHTGCAVDVGTPGCTELTEDFEATPAFRWLTEHAGAFGFSMPYGRENAQGVIYEPWHWCWRDRIDEPLKCRCGPRADRLDVTFSGRWVLAAFHPLLEAIRDAAEQHGLRHVLVDARAVPDNIAAAERDEAGKQIAAMLPGLRIALLFDPARTTRLAENTAVNGGADMAIFGEPDEAMAWLRGDATRPDGA